MIKKDNMKKLFTLLSLVAVTVITTAVSLYIIHKDDCNKRYDCDDLMEE